MTPYITIEQIDQAADAVRTRTSYRPRVGLILGSGLNDLADAVQKADIIPYADLPNWPISTVQGHAGRLVIGELDGQTVLVMQGRIHFYEGYGMSQITLPVRVMQPISARAGPTLGLGQPWHDTGAPGQPFDFTMPSPLPALGGGLSGFAARLKAARERLGITLADLDCFGSFAIREIKCWESGQDEPPHYVIENLCLCLECDPAELYNDAGGPAVKKLRPNKYYWAGLRDPFHFSGVGERLTQSRKQAGYSIGDTAKIIGCPAALLKRIETEEQADANINAEGWAPLGTLAALFGVELDWLKYGDEAMAVERRRLARRIAALGIKPRPRKSKTAAA